MSAQSDSAACRRVVSVALLAVLHACASAGTTPANNGIAIVGVTVIDPSSSQPAALDQTILIADGVIRAVGPSPAIAIPAGARRVEGRGKFAIPGLWDAHVHFMNTGVTALPLFVALGVTSVREMGGYIDSTRAWQARMKAGTLVGPRVFTPGPILESRAISRAWSSEAPEPARSWRCASFRIESASPTRPARGGRSTRS